MRLTKEEQEMVEEHRKKERAEKEAVYREQIAYRLTGKLLQEGEMCSSLADSAELFAEYIKGIKLRKKELQFIEDNNLAPLYYELFKDVYKKIDSGFTSAKAVASKNKNTILMDLFNRAEEIRDKMFELSLLIPPLPQSSILNLDSEARNCFELVYNEIKDLTGTTRFINAGKNQE